MKLKAKEMCPLHRRRDCCGRSEFHRYERIKHSKWTQVRPGVRKLADDTVPGGWRYLLSSGERRKVIMRKLDANGHTCGICDKPIEDMRDVVPDHIEPKGMGGARADDGKDGANLQPAHNSCNIAKGSQRNFKGETQ